MATPLDLNLLTEGRPRGATIVVQASAASAAPTLYSPRAPQPRDERRLANDGLAYTYDEFMTYFGDSGNAHWQRAPPLQLALELALAPPNHPEAGRQAAEAARSMENEPSSSRASQPATPADSANRDWFVLEPLTGNETNDDPETRAIFLQQFGLHDATADSAEPAAPAPKRRRGISAFSIQPSTSGASQPATLTPP